MDKKDVINIVEEVISLFRDSIKKELTGKYTSLGRNEVIILLNGVETGLFKKIGLYEEKSTPFNKE